MTHILFIEDNIEYAKILTKILKSEGYELSMFHSPSDAIDFFENNEAIIDLVIADLDIEPINGLQIAEFIYKQNPNLPVMILTGSVDDDDEKDALNIGVSEYVRKSVSFTVLLSRIKHTLEQSKIMMPRKLSYHSSIENLTLDDENMTILKDDVEITLTVLEFRLLQYFLTNRNRIIPREEFLKNVWKYDVNADIDSRIVDTYIKNLRRKTNVKSIFTIRGVGYRWNE